MKTFITFSILLLAFAQAKFIHFDPPTKIVGGDEAALHGFPYQVAIFIQVPQGTGFCGGSLISDKHILTAAHCVSSASSALVMVGAHNIKAEESNRQEFNTTSFAVHEQWFPLFILNDIAIIKINDAIQVDGVTVKILALAPATEDAVLTGLQATVSGWGKDSDAAQGVSSVLRYVNSTIIENSICKIFYFGNIRDEHICMNGWEGKSSCQGDSGGPLVMTRDGELTQYGVVSFGIIFGCEKGWPSAAIFILDVDDEDLFCGGSLCSRYHVLTAAHCLYNARESLILLGAHNITVNEPNVQHFVSSRFFVHPRYSSSTIHNDIAVIMLPKPAVINEFVQIISLHQNQTLLFGQEGTVSGWGLQSTKARDISPVLRHVSLRIVFHFICSATYKDFTSGTQICQHEAKGKSTCSGDSGGPVVVYDRKKRRRIQVGVVSFGHRDGCEVGKPVVQTRVSAYYSWIESIIKNDY
ncbi:hypothetical protein PPYR_02023 [Photinus pyralis]|uniref:Peptidase S1 domain-containing protein n=1 Tax=Photinus pyralis TaxID=7054 RepID=A0A5N4B680_PHOPY|nr:hypothetical protein PPYR_02023 [Photinus pyralis]